MSQQYVPVVETEAFRQLVAMFKLTEPWAIDLLAQRIAEAVNEIGEITREEANIAEADAEAARRFQAGDVR